jgi:23S rRNA pseudouridine1911/1915/1917 synthase
MPLGPTDKTLDKDVILSAAVAAPKPLLNKGWVYHDQVQSDAAGRTVLDFYASRYTHSSRQEWQQRLTNGQIELDGVSAQAATKLKTGQYLDYHRLPWHEPPAPRAIKILWQDCDLLIVAKPSGLQVLPGGPFLQNTLLSILREAYPADKNLTPVHRLGRGTSGIMAIARSPLARQHLARDWRQGAVKKTYRALAQTTDMPATFVVEMPIGKIPYAPLSQIYAASASGKPARSLCSVLERRGDQDCTLLKIEIPTGRPHQIRIHLAAAGYPLVGDPLYIKGGQPKPIEPNTSHPVPGDGGYLLHAYRLAFNHPRTLVPQVFICDPPESLTHVTQHRCIW